jgi:dipeptidyl aminopeptidase/acylaminoacyl peptidase
VDNLTAPLLVVHGAHDTNVPVSESEQIVEALRDRDRTVKFLLFDDDGHGIDKRENRTILAAEINQWLTDAFSTARAAS